MPNIEELQCPIPSKYFGGAHSSSALPTHSVLKGDEDVFSMDLEWRETISIPTEKEMKGYSAACEELQYIMGLQCDKSFLN